MKLTEALLKKTIREELEKISENITINKEELRNMLYEAYSEGFVDGDSSSDAKHEGYEGWSSVKGWENSSAKEKANSL